MSYTLLPTPPLEVLACVKFSPFDNNLLLSAYDGSVLLYKCLLGENVAAKDIAHFRTDNVVTSAAITHSATFSGLLDGTIRLVDYENMKLSGPVYGRPSSDISAAVNNLCSVSGHSNIVVGSTIAGELIYVDSRSQRTVQTLNTQSKIFAMDTTNTYVTVAQSSRQVQIYDVRKWEKPMLTRCSGLKYQITALQNFPSMEGYALSSLDGRVSFEYYEDLPEAQQLKFAFKCHRHRDTVSNSDHVYSVNALRFHKDTNTLFTGGGDGHVCLWDWLRRKRTKQFAAVEGMAISQLDISHDGAMLVVGATDDLYLRARDYDSGVLSGGSRVYLKRLDEREWTKR